MKITVEKAEKNSLTFAYVWRGEPNEAPPAKSFHTSVEGDEGKMIVITQACQWVTAQQSVQRMSGRLGAIWTNDRATHR